MCINSHVFVLRALLPFDNVVVCFLSWESSFFFLKFILFIHFWLRWVFVAVSRLSLVAASGGYSSLWCVGFSLWWLLLLRSSELQVRGLQQLQRTGSVVVVRGLQSAGSVAPQHVGSSPTRARTLVPCIGRRILNHCATREARSRRSLLPGTVVNTVVVNLKGKDGENQRCLLVL